MQPQLLLIRSWPFQAAAMGAESDLLDDAAAPPPKDFKPGRRERVELIIPNVRRFTPGQHVTSRLAGPAHMFRIQMDVYPKGMHPPHTHLWAGVLLHAPEGHSKQEITVQVKTRLKRQDSTVPRFKSKGGTFTSSDPRRLWGKFVPFSELVSPQSGWMNEQGEVRLETLVIFPLERLAPILWPPLDFTEEMSQVTFRLSEGPPVYFDKRILVARSEYFREMLAGDAWKEAKSGEVDLSKNPHMNHRNLQAILQFLCDGTFSSDADTAKALAVRCIADEYRLTQLVVQAESLLFSG